MKSLDRKLAEVKANPASKAFIIADAKDADMAFGVRAPGPRSYLSTRGERPARFSPEIWTRNEYGYRNLPEFLDIIRGRPPRPGRHHADVRIRKRATDD